MSLWNPQSNLQQQNTVRKPANVKKWPREEKSTLEACCQQNLASKHSQCRPYLSLKWGGEADTCKLSTRWVNTWLGKQTSIPLLLNTNYYYYYYCCYYWIYFWKAWMPTWLGSPIQLAEPQGASHWVEHSKQTTNSNLQYIPLIITIFPSWKIHW